MRDVGVLCTILGVVSVIALVALYTVGQLMREVQRLKNRKEGK